MIGSCCFFNTANDLGGDVDTIVQNDWKTLFDTVKAGYALGGGIHEEDEIYYILSGKGKLQLDDKIIDVAGGQVIFIPAGCFHALDNSQSDEDMCILTFWRDWRFNDAYETRVKLWGKSFKTIDEE